MERLLVLDIPIDTSIPEILTHFTEQNQITDTQIYDLQLHGCHCTKLSDLYKYENTENVQLGGYHKFDEFDEICFEWNQGESFNLAFDENLEPDCNFEHDPCLKAICQIDTSHSKKLIQAFKDWDKIDSNPWSVIRAENGDCPNCSDSINPRGAQACHLPLEEKCKGIKAEINMQDVIMIDAQPTCQPGTGLIYKDSAKPTSCMKTKQNCHNYQDIINQQDNNNECQNECHEDPSGNCYKDSSARDLSHGIVRIPAGQQNSITWCQNYCFEKGYIYSANQYSVECFCGNTFGKYGLAENQENCNKKCQDLEGNICGGSWHQNIYLSGSREAVNGGTSTGTCQPGCVCPEDKPIWDGDLNKCVSEC